MIPTQSSEHAANAYLEKQQKLNSTSSHKDYETVGTIFKSKWQQRPRLDSMIVCMALLLPCFLFTVISAVLSFYVRRSRPGLVCFVVVSGGSVPILLGIAAVQYRRRYSFAETTKPMWLMFLFISTFVAWAAALVMGNSNYDMNFRPYYDWMNLKMYHSVMPENDPGQAVLDAGRLVFSRGSRLSQDLAVSFRNVDTYCVAPVVSSAQPLASYDFWATGINCCGDATINASLRGASVREGSGFQCGQDYNVTGGGGLRVLDNAALPFFRLAVEQAKSKYNINVNHPIFITWSQDPLGEMSKYADNGLKNYLLGILLFFGFQVFLVASLIVTAVHGYQ